MFVLNDKKIKFSNKTRIAQAVLIASLALNAYAQEEPTSLEEVIVTGTPGGAGISKLDASFAVTNVSADDIEKAAAHSTADLLKEIPGVWIEASGGVAGANVDVRGFPGGSDAPFFTVAINGMPVYAPPTLSFLENTTLFRVDETIKAVQGLRGGPNPVLSNGQPGLTANFVLKEGGEETEGKIKYTRSDYDLNRIDAVFSGALTDNVYYMVGGYASTSPGVRDAGFLSEKGSQFTANITWDLDEGKANLFHRATDDHGTWYLPSPASLGNDYTQVGPANRNVLVPFTGLDNAGNSTVEYQRHDLAEGRGWDGSVTGFSFESEFGEGWTFIERVLQTSGDADTLGFVSGGGPVALNTLTDLNGAPINSATTVSGASVAGTDLVQAIGPWVVRKQISALSNDLTLTKDFESSKLTMGYYTSAWDVRETWSLGNQKYYQLGQNGEQIASTGLAGEIPCNALDFRDANGQATCVWSYDVDATGDAQEDAFYVAFESDVSDTITADIGLRFANRSTDYSVDQGFLDGRFDTFSADEDGVAATLGLNLALSDEAGVFFRYNSGFKFADFDDYRNFGTNFRNGSDLIIDIDQFEVGYKLVSDDFEVFATLFSNVTEGQPNCPIGGQSCSRDETATVGVELDSTVNLGDAFAVKVNGTYQQAEYTNGANDGNDILRQPALQLRISPSYGVEFDNGSTASVYSTVAWVDDRFSDAGNTITLPSYTTIDLGGVYSYDNVSFRVAVDNLSDEEGITEGDPRDTTSGNVRFILPRNINVSVAYEF